MNSKQNLQENNEYVMIRRRYYFRAISVCIVFLGFLLVTGAVGLTVWNIRTDVNAGELNQELVQIVYDTIEAGLEDRRQNGDPSDDNKSRSEPSNTTIDFTPGLFEAEELLPDEKKEIKSVIVDGREYIGILYIPILGLELSVMKTCDDKSVDKGPGRWNGTPYRDGFVIGGHNYRSHLGKIDRLRDGDQVIFTDMRGRCFEYRVIGQEILEANQGELLRNQEWALSLFTCTLAGDRRIVVRCTGTEDG